MITWDLQDLSINMSINIYTITYLYVWCTLYIYIYEFITVNSRAIYDINRITDVYNIRFFSPSTIPSNKDSRRVSTCNAGWVVLKFKVDASGLVSSGRSVNHLVTLGNGKGLIGKGLIFGNLLDKKGKSSQAPFFRGMFVKTRV